MNERIPSGISKIWERLWRITATWFPVEITSLGSRNLREIWSAVPLPGPNQFDGFQIFIVVGKEPDHFAHKLSCFFYHHHFQVSHQCFWIILCWIMMYQIHEVLAKHQQEWKHFDTCTSVDQLFLLWEVFIMSFKRSISILRFSKEARIPSTRTLRIIWFSTRRVFVTFPFHSYSCYPS